MSLLVLLILTHACAFILGTIWELWYWRRWHDEEDAT